MQNFVRTTLLIILLLLVPRFFPQSDSPDLISNNSLVGLPIIHNYLPSDYNATPQNWSIVQDHRGIVYFANTGGLLEYDGVAWRLIGITNKIARALAIDKNGIIYVGGINQFGFLRPDSIGNMEYVSLIPLLPAGDREFEDIWSIWSSGKGVYFQSTSRIFLIKDPVNSLRKLNHDNVKIWRSKSLFNPAFLVNDNYYIPQNGKGLFTFSGDSLIQVWGGEIFADETIYDMLGFPPSDNSGNKILICTSDRGFFIYDGKSFRQFKTEIDSYLLKHKPYFGGALLNDDTYAIGTQTGGLVIIDKNGRLLKLINKRYGLHDNTVWFVYPDNSGNMWLGLNNGITRINYPSPLSVADSRFGIDGIIFSMNNYRGRIYLSTPNGVYHSTTGNMNETGQDFELVEGITSESWGMLSLDNMQLVGTTGGIYKITGDKAVKINTGWRFAYSLCRSRVDSNIIYVGLHDGLAKLQYLNGDWYDAGRIPGISEIVPKVVEDSDGTLWLSTYNKGLVRVIPQSEGNNASYSITKFEKDKFGSQVSILIFHNKIIFGTSEGIMSFDKGKNEFEPDSSLGNYFIKDYNVIDLAKDIRGNIWILGTKKNSFETDRIIINDNDSIIRETFPGLKIIAENILGFNPYRIFPDRNNENIIWITANEKLYRFDIDKSGVSSSETKFNTLIRKVNINGNKVVYYGGYSQKDLSGKDSVWNLADGVNSIEFNYSSSSYLQENGNKYRYMLEGFDDGWSDWTSESKKEYTNLSSGEYRFRVQGLNVSGITGEEASFAFVIPVPWYKSVWAITLLILISIFGVLWIFNFRIRILEKRNLELEAIVDKRTNEVRHQKDTLEVQAKKLLELDRMKSNFFTNISHEFRTPLTLVMGQIENLLNTINDETTRNKLLMALSNSKQLQSLINRLLELSRLESGEMKIKIAETELNSFLRKIISTFESLTERRKIKLEFNKADAKIFIFIDREKMEEVFNNLISNAIKFTPDSGKISLTILRNPDATDYVEIRLTDTGIGIKPEHLPHIFDRFYQVDSSQKRNYEGTGIGLAIVKELVELHNGWISVKSVPTEGTEFTVLLPLGKDYFSENPNVEFVNVPNKIIETEKEPDFTAELKRNELLTSEDENENQEQDVIMVVEDNQDMRSFIKENLMGNFKIIEAKNGEEGVNRAFDTIPDLIITDVMMPAMDGYELSANLKSDKKTSHIPIIMLTAKADEESKLKGLHIGVDDYLIKPFSTKELNVRVDNLIKLRKLLKDRYKEISAMNISDIEAKPIDQEFLEKVFENIRTHIEDPGYGVAKLADEVGMSVSQLNRKLNALINQSAGKLIRSTKLDYASQLLKKRAGNISEIAFRVGFSDTPGFTHSFKEKFGCTPSEYLKSLK